MRTLLHPRQHAPQLCRMKLSLVCGSSSLVRNFPHLSQRLPYHQNCATETRRRKRLPCGRNSSVQTVGCHGCRESPGSAQELVITQVTKRTNILDIYIVAEKKGLSARCLKPHDFNGFQPADFEVCTSHVYRCRAVSCPANMSSKSTPPPSLWGERAKRSTKRQLDFSNGEAGARGERRAAQTLGSRGEPCGC